MRMHSIFLLGISILAGAIILNILASHLGLMSWFEFLKKPSQANASSYVWLFFVYPLSLGIIAYFVAKLLNL